MRSERPAARIFSLINAEGLCFDTQFESEIARLLLVERCATAQSRVKCSRISRRERDCPLEGLA
eukprot:6196163-Pleurochrysis_carterae.AAC.2